MNVTAIHPCPRCHGQLQLDRIGGLGRGPGAQPARPVWLCTTCWTVHPEDLEPAAPNTDAPAERRRDLA